MSASCDLCAAALALAQSRLSLSLAEQTSSNGFLRGSHTHTHARTLIASPLGKAVRRVVAVGMVPKSCERYLSERLASSGRRQRAPRTNFDTVRPSDRPTDQRAAERPLISADNRFVASVDKCFGTKGERFEASALRSEWNKFWPSRNLAGTSWTTSERQCPSNKCQ